MAGYNNLDAHFGGALYNGFKIVNLEPEQHAVPIWFVIRISDWAVMVFYCEAVQLKNKLSIGDQLFVCRAPMIAPAAEETLIPSAACFHIGYRDQRLRTHLRSVSTPD
jgi:hypothetical protein